MKFLHTSDWHIGKTLKGRNRIEEQQAVLREIIGIARREQFDAVLVAGDLYETLAPSAEAQKLVVRALLELRRTGAEVIAIAGNHDHAATFDAYRPVMDAVGIRQFGTPRPAADGGVVTFTARSTGERVNVAVLPFVSQRYAVRAAELLTGTPAENTGKYDQRARDMITGLCQGFTSDAVNIVMAHLTVTGGKLGGGERPAQSIFEYHVPASAFGADPHYVALGHLHRRQSVPAACPVHYSGSPLAVDFGEEDNTNVVLSVQATPGTPASVTEIPVTSGRQLRTVRGTVTELVAQVAEFGQDYLRVYVREAARAGLREEIEAALPNALEVRIDPEYAAPATMSRPHTTGPDRTPSELFADYCGERNIDDSRLRQLFDQLHDEATTAGRTGA